MRLESQISHFQLLNPFDSILRAIGLSPKLYYCRDIDPYRTLLQISTLPADFSKASGYCTRSRTRSLRHDLESDSVDVLMRPTLFERNRTRDRQAGLESQPHVLVELC
ncbi:MAG: hypothetical protein JGK26_03970 [Microcoleus sp. PH2017_27_LUM_O_A]|uniref:hypothetical protein n=1 Tax=unclassified Microcoleus TaxID=2642155 RepID=UPI001DD272BE|nr:MULTISPECIES: hypothetical protein [unclassified Microcoleus]MCC3458861.1 hypothetical protein [Microcoleus sp. PH2017_11_PCY_U_A]MCC3477094.1 hypothetical protein [Microcoleus sp. PH2017_12_PCY_D_A]MCC3528295.1 hypothetical protein [Microcoleus sp. PH2017_21_RUC_O_A]MCC3540472.1 hypothetical protein [Microcoleus sp. PH2017_22_RUC_O_B]MCC3558287.1 hypothetical protein [Microcoleus sp. PH2017_27_LUM_O_A]